MKIVKKLSIATVLSLVLLFQYVPYAFAQNKIITCSTANGAKADPECAQIIQSVDSEPQALSASNTSFINVNGAGSSRNIFKIKSSQREANEINVRTNIYFPKGTRPQTNYLLLVQGNWNKFFDAGIANDNETDDFINGRPEGIADGCVVARYLNDAELSTASGSYQFKRPPGVISTNLPDDKFTSLRQVADQSGDDKYKRFLLISVYSQGSVLPPIDPSINGKNLYIVENGIKSKVGNKDGNTAQEITGFLSFYQTRVKDNVPILNMREYRTGSFLYPSSLPKTKMICNKATPDKLSSQNINTSGSVYNWTEYSDNNDYFKQQICKSLTFEAVPFTNAAGQQKFDYKCVGCQPNFNSVDLFGNRVDGVETAIGCLPQSINGVISALVRIGIGVAAGIAFLRIVYAFIMIMTNGANPEVVKNSQSMITSAVIGLIVIILSVFILNFFGIKVLEIGNYGGGFVQETTK